jgi:hypothetical protein
MHIKNVAEVGFEPAVYGSNIFTDWAKLQRILTSRTLADSDWSKVHVQMYTVLAERFGEKTRGLHCPAGSAPPRP